MSYTLQAFVGKSPHLSGLSAAGGKIVALAQGFALVPLSKSFLESTGIEWLALLEGTSSTLEAVHNLCKRIAIPGPIAYIEAMFWGGDGTQGSILLPEGDRGATPVLGTTAINEALRALGAHRGSAVDEFAALGLGKHRDTEGWVANDA